MDEKPKLARVGVVTLFVLSAAALSLQAQGQAEPIEVRGGCRFSPG